MIVTKEALKHAFLDNLFYIQGKFPALATKTDYYMALAYAALGVGFGLLAGAGWDALVARRYAAGGARQLRGGRRGRQRR